MTFQEFATFLGMPFERLRIYPYSLRNFPFPRGHSLDTLVQTLYRHEVYNPYNENIYLFTPRVQVIAKIIFL